MTAALVHNGGRSQVNPNFLLTGGDFPFLNAMKSGQAWSRVSGDVAITPDILDADGYPTSIPGGSGGIYTSFYVPTQAARPGNYVITWTGNGTIYVGSNNTLVSGSKTSTGGSGRYVFSTTANQFLIGVSAVGSPHITNIKVFHADDEEALTAGDVFGVKFKERLLEGKFGVFRCLDWQFGNTTNVTTWETRKPTTYAFYHGAELRSGLYAGAASISGGTIFSASAPSTWSGLVDKATVHVLFSNSGNLVPVQATFTNSSANIGMTGHGLSINKRVAFDPNNGVTIPSAFTAKRKYWVVSVPDVNTITVSATQGGAAITSNATSSGIIWGNPVLTMNIGSTGDIDMLSETTEPLSERTNSYPSINTFRSIATLVYDADLNAWLKKGGDLARNSIGLMNGVPPELMMQLCAEIGAHPHFVTPPYAIDPATDFMPSLAAYCRDNGPSWMIPRFEGPNELWNTTAGFDQTYYADAKANAYKAADPTNWTATDDYHNWYGKAMSVLGQAISAVYSADRTKYQVLCGVQTALATSPAGTTASNPRLSSAAYVAQSAAAQSGYVKSAASNWVTTVCVANYVNPGLQDSTTGTVNEADLATAYAGGDTTAPKTYVDSLNPANSVVTFTNGTPGTVNWTAHGRSANDPVFFMTTGTMGTVSLSRRFVKTVLGVDSFTISATAGGAAEAFSGSYTGTAYGFAAFRNTTIPGLLVIHRNWKAWAAGFGIGKMCGYEGGYSPDYASLGDSDLDRLKAAGKLVTATSANPLGLHGLTRLNYDNFLSLSDGSVTFEFPSCYLLAANINITGYSRDVWSVLEDVYVSTNPPQWEAIRLFNARLRRHSLVATT